MNSSKRYFLYLFCCCDDYLNESRMMTQIILYVLHHKVNWLMNNLTYLKWTFCHIYVLSSWKFQSPPCQNVHVPKCPQCRNVLVPQHPRRQNVGPEMSSAKMSGAEMSPSHNGVQTVTVTYSSLSNWKFVCRNIKPLGLKPYNC